MASGTFLGAMLALRMAPWMGCRIAAAVGRVSGEGSISRCQYFGFERVGESRHGAATHNNLLLLALYLPNDESLVLWALQNFVQVKTAEKGANWVWQISICRSLTNRPLTTPTQPLTRTLRWRLGLLLPRQEEQIHLQGASLRIWKDHR